MTNSLVIGLVCALGPIGCSQKKAPPEEDSSCSMDAAFETLGDATGYIAPSTDDWTITETTPQRVFIDSSGRMIVASPFRATRNHYFVRISDDSGASWTDTFEYQYDTSANSTGIDVGQLSDGRLIQAGSATDITGIAHAVIRVSSDDGETSTNLDDYQRDGTRNSGYQRVLVSGETVIGVGSHQNSSSETHGMMRVSVDSGENWATASDFNPSSVLNASAFRDGAITDDDSIIVAGYGRETSTGYYRWLILKSADFGATWTALYNQVFENSTAQSSVESIKVDASGAIWATGGARDTSGVLHWITLKSSDEGVTWSVVDSYIHTASYDSSGKSIWFDETRERIYVLGYGKTTPGSGTTPGIGIVRVSDDAGETWSNLDEFEGISGGYTEGRSIVQDATGSVFAFHAARAGAGASLTTWFARKLGCN